MRKIMKKNSKKRENQDIKIIKCKDERNERERETSIERERENTSISGPNNIFPNPPSPSPFNPQWYIYKGMLTYFLL